MYDFSRNRHYSTCKLPVTQKGYVMHSYHTPTQIITETCELKLYNTNIPLKVCYGFWSRFVYYDFFLSNCHILCACSVNVLQIFPSGETTFILFQDMFILHFNFHTRQARDPPWLWKPGQRSAEAQTSGPTKKD